MWLAPAVIMFFGASAIVVLLVLNLDKADWREATPLILWRAAFMVAMGLAIGAFLLISSR